MAVHRPESWHVTATGCLICSTIKFTYCYFIFSFALGLDDSIPKPNLIETEPQHFQAFKLLKMILFQNYSPHFSSQAIHISNFRFSLILPTLFVNSRLTPTLDLLKNIFQ